MKLYEIDAAIEDCVDKETGDIVDIEKLEALEMERDAKISNLACWIKDLAAEEKAIKEEEDNLAKRRKVVANKKESVNNFLKAYLNGCKYKDSRVSISYRTSTSTEIDEDLDLNTLPDEYKRVKIEPAKTAIKEALQAGEIIEGCRLVENTSMIIK